MEEKTIIPPRKRVKGRSPLQVQGSALPAGGPPSVLIFPQYTPIFICLYTHTHHMHACGQPVDDLMQFAKKAHLLAISLVHRNVIHKLWMLWTKRKPFRQESCFWGSRRPKPAKFMQGMHPLEAGIPGRETEYNQKAGTVHMPVVIRAVFPHLIPLAKSRQEAGLTHFSTVSTPPTAITIYISLLSMFSERMIPCNLP